jgi:hypothetical protein
MCFFYLELVLTHRNGARRGKGFGRAGEEQGGLGRMAGDGCGPSGRGADDGERSTELRRAARQLGHGRRRAREKGEHERERELGERERKELEAFIEREGRGEGTREERPAFNAINGAVSLH